MISKLVLDSSILVEYSKGNKTELLEYLIAETNIDLFINSTVLSEYTFHWLANKGQKAPRTLQQAQQIRYLIEPASLELSLAQFTVLPSSNDIIPIYLRLMQQYNLLPNDALILATAILHQIPAFASYDPDFIAACQGEGIRLVREISDL